MPDRINALKTLLTRLLDSKEGYRDAVDRVESSNIQSVLEDLLDRRIRNSAELGSYLVREGYTVPDDGTLLASVHRIFVDLKDKLSSSDDAATLAEIVRGESVLLDAYDDAIAAADGHDPEYQFLVEQHASLASAISRLKARTDLAA